MTTVRKASEATLTLSIFVAGLIILEKMCDKWDAEFLYRMNWILSTRVRIGTIHSIVLTVSFWLLLITSAIVTIYHDRKGFAIFGAFGIPIVFSGCMAIWVLIPMFEYIDLRWFWLFYYVMMMICTKLSYNKIAKLKGGGPIRIKEFFKTPPSKYDVSISMLDRYVLFLCKSALLMLWFLQIILIVVFCIQYRTVFLLI